MRRVLALSLTLATSMAVAAPSQAQESTTRGFTLGLHLSGIGKS